ncbi:semaphorin-4B-like isoform X2 [Genypterus blacodes]|uniref:semaphorin-4B-like isoform X2 n=1 Tax=Genypterus blacodes TaxID=154954 RepID=UPI003F76B129
MASGVFLLFLLLSSSGSAPPPPPPRVSFLLNSADRPLVHFTAPGIYNTTTLLLSTDASTLYVGAKNAILSLNVSQHDIISLKNKVEWSPSPREINDCENKGKDPTVDCPNFVRVLQPLNSTHLYACGSHAYSPQDAYIEVDGLSLVKQRSGVKVRCPFNPFQRNTALSISGELFTATMSDFRGVRPTISRHFSKDGRPDVSQDSSVSLLEEPVFVGSALDSSERKLYFFFSEVGKEFSYTNELRVARVAQVCKDDVGGLRTLQKKWTSFAKASLLCQPPRQLPYSVLQDVFTLPPPEGSTASDTLFYGIFSSQWSSGSDSAVCVFRLQDVRSVFSGGYRSFDSQTHSWSPLQGKHTYLGQCGLEEFADPDLAQVKKSFLTSSAVQPVGNVPVLVSMGQSYSRVAAMTTQAVSGKQYTVLFLLTESGFLHKVVLSDRGPRLIEEIQVFAQVQQVKSIVLSSSKGVLYVGTCSGVTAVPVAHCASYRTCSQCVLARDPLCGWSRTKKICSRPSSGTSNMSQDVESGNVGRECQGQTGAAPRPGQDFLLRQRQNRKHDPSFTLH